MAPKLLIQSTWTNFHNISLPNYKNRLIIVSQETLYMYLPKLESS